MVFDHTFYPYRWFDQPDASKVDAVSEIREAIRMPEIRVRNKRSLWDAQEMILAMAKYGNHYLEDYKGVRLETDEDVRRFIEAHGLSFGEFVEDHRNKDKNVSMFENLIGGSFRVDSGEGSVSYIDETGEKTVLASGGEAGWFTVPGYLGLFEQAVEDFDRCVNSMKYGDFLSCVSNGVASIEAYIEQRARIHNKHNPDNQLVDTKQNKVSRDDKVDEWIPVMTGGTKLNKGNQRWEHYKKLRGIRDQGQAHLKAPALGSDDRKLTKLLNFFRTGIAGMLLDLHILFGDHKVPATIIRRAYLPKVEYEADRRGAANEP